MKIITRLLLIILLIYLFFIVFKFYIYNPVSSEFPNELNKNAENSIEKVENNLIENLNYEVQLSDNRKYLITSEKSDIKYNDNNEIINMFNVNAIITYDNKFPFVITADEAIYNNSNYKTNFNQNIKIKYMQNIITANNMSLDLINNIVILNNDINYNGLDFEMSADNVLINLITKEITIFTDDKKNNVRIKTK